MAEKTPGPTALLPVDLELQRRTALRNAILIVESQAASKMDFEKRLLKQITQMNEATGLFRMWTHPDDWGELGVRLGFKRRCRLGDMLYGVYAGNGSNCEASVSTALRWTWPT
ncbi:MAG: hypothetical protein ACRERU_03235 [Methylococcales bacterium]